MAPWQRKARFVVAAIGITFAVVLVFAFRSRESTPAPAPVDPVDPKAVVVASGGTTIRLNRNRQEVVISYERAVSYQDGSTQLYAVKVITERAGGKVFTITGSEARIGANESTIALTGDVHVSATDGMDFKTGSASYNQDDGVVRAPGRVEFAREGMRGSGFGMTYDNNLDLLTILTEAAIHMEPDDQAGGPVDITAGWAEINRPARTVRFERGMKAVRTAEIIESDLAVAHLTEDEKRLERVELRGNARITGTNAAAGALQAMNGRDIDLDYRDDGATLERANVMGDAVVQIHGQPGQVGRRIIAETLTLVLLPDGTTPNTLTARRRVEVTVPAEGTTPGRTIAADNLDASGRAGQGLTDARFAGRVRFREQAGRAANAERLDLAMQPGFGTIDEARFAGAVVFEEGAMRATAASARYAVTKESLQLSGAETASPTPHVHNEQVTVDATKIDIGLDGPTIRATGNVRSELRAAADGSKESASRMPSMLERDRPVLVTAESLAYDKPSGRAVYTGTEKRPAQLTQGDTTIKGTEIVVDEKNGDLSATGAVTTTFRLEQETKDGKREPVTSTATARAFKYEEASRRATYTGAAHVTGVQGDLTAERVELYLAESGNELERLEAYDAVKLRDERYRVDGARLSYTAASDEYVVTGRPVTAVDDCNRTSTGHTLIYMRSTDRIVLTRDDGRRTQTDGTTKCP
jgi:LPS export ABC transporter protein LptC/lipopolysaccharide transport protein LptA